MQSFQSPFLIYEHINSFGNFFCKCSCIDHLCTLNEVRLYLQDKGDLAFGLLLPILTFALMFGAFGGETMYKATATVVDEDGGIYSQQLIEKLDAVDGVSIDLLSAEDADARLERSDILIALFIPSGFSDTLASGGQAELIQDFAD